MYEYEKTTEFAERRIFRKSFQTKARVYRLPKKGSAILRCLFIFYEMFKQKRNVESACQNRRMKEY